MWLSLKNGHRCRYMKKCGEFCGIHSKTNKTSASVDNFDDEFSGNIDIVKREEIIGIKNPNHRHVWSTKKHPYFPYYQLTDKLYIYSKCKNCDCYKNSPNKTIDIEQLMDGSYSEYYSVKIDGLTIRQLLLDRSNHIHNMTDWRITGHDGPKHQYLLKRNCKHHPLCLYIEDSTSTDETSIFNSKSLKMHNDEYDQNAEIQKLLNLEIDKKLLIENARKFIDIYCYENQTTEIPNSQEIDNKFPQYILDDFKFNPIYIYESNDYITTFEDGIFHKKIAFFY